MNGPLAELLDRYRIRLCLDCGKCTGSCPLARVERDFSPRLLTRRIIQEGLGSDYVREMVWACSTCGLCNERCPSGVDFSGFVRALRPVYRDLEVGGRLSHGGALQTLMRLQADPGLSQNRLAWLEPGLKTSDQGEVLFFSGCLAYLQVFFAEFNLDLTGIGRAVVKILNRLGIEPVLLAGERCCGHDLYYAGDEETFSALRRLNLEAIRGSGAKTVVTACAECAHVLKNLYPEPGSPLGFQVFHLSQFLVEAGLGGGTGPRPGATFQDPCRLARYQRIWEAPRRLLETRVELKEMAHFGPAAWCCGSPAWLGCDRYVKRVQLERLKEARETGGRMIVTACPKCQIHLACAMRDPGPKPAREMELIDLACLIAGDE